MGAELDHTVELMPAGVLLGMAYRRGLCTTQEILMAAQLQQAGVVPVFDPAVVTSGST